MTDKHDELEEYDYGNRTDDEYRDEIVETAIDVLEKAAAALKENNQYNSAEIPYPDYYPNGIKDAARCLLEPFIRTHVCMEMSQARDCAGYAALMVAWVMAGMPESRFAPIMKRFYDKFYKMLKESDMETGGNLGNPEWN